MIRLNFILACILLLGCKTPKIKTTKSSVTENSIKSDALNVIVVDKRDLDGCGFLLLKKDGTYLDPINLGKQFQVNAKTLNIKYHILKGRMGVCMAGEIVELDEIKESLK